MSTAQEFDVVVNGIEYHVYASTHGSNDHFTVTTNNGALTVTDSFGDCNPLRSLWQDWRYQSVHGAARHALEGKCIKNAVEREIEAHMEFCLQQIEDGEIDQDAEIRAGREREEKARIAAERRAETDEWNRKVQSAAARRDAQTAHAVSERLSVIGSTVVFDGQAFGWERTEHGNIKIDRALNDAARKSGLRGQAIGELYSLAQQMVSHG